MAKILQDTHKLARFYLDDAIGFSGSWSDHLEYLGIVFVRIRDAGLNRSKCEYGFATVEFYGHRVVLSKVQLGELNVKAMVEFPRQSNRKQLQSWLGLASYFVNLYPHVHNYFSLIRYDEERLNDQAERAFLAIESVHVPCPVLRQHNFENPFGIAVDASDTAISGDLFQCYDNK